MVNENILKCDLKVFVPYESIPQIRYLHPTRLSLAWRAKRNFDHAVAGDLVLRC